MTATEHTDATTTLAGIRARIAIYDEYAERNERRHFALKHIGQPYQAVLAQDVHTLLDHVAALQRQLADAQTRERAAVFVLLAQMNGRGERATHSLYSTLEQAKAAAEAGGIPELNTKWHQHPISEEWDCRVYYDAPVVGDEEDCTYSVHWSVREMSIYQATQPQENSHE